jgi:hypothetical protein
MTPKTTYEHVGQFLAQISKFGITDVHKIRLFPLSLSRTTFNWFVSLPPNSVDTWDRLKQKFHNYFYNGETELRLSNLVTVKQRDSETVGDMWRFRDTMNKCYGLTIGEKDLAELAFAGLSTTLKDEMEGHDFIDINQVMQWAMVHENRAREHKAHSRFKEISAKDKPGVNCVDGSSDSEEEVEVCVTEWVESPKDKPVACSFLRPSPGKRDEMRFTFDVNKCDRLFDVLTEWCDLFE